MPRALAVLLLAAQFAVHPSFAADDQAGAERSKQPVSARIILSGGGEMYGDERIGNVEVTYADGTKDRWTKKGNCGQAHVAADGTVGWTIYEAERRLPNLAYTVMVRNNRTVVLCRRGKIVARIYSGPGFIDKWGFLDGGRQIALRAQNLHGPVQIERHDSATSYLLENVPAFASDPSSLPAWAKPFVDG